MANLEHLQELEKGADSWNKWLLHLNEQKIDRRTIDLSNADLSGKEKKWSEYDFEGVNLKSVNLKFSDLTNANFLLADLSDADLRCATIRYAEFNQATLDSANFANADLFGAKFNRTKLNRANLKGVDARNTFFAQASCIETNFTGAMLDDAKLQESNLKGAIFQSAVLLNTNLSSSNLTETDFQESNLLIAILNNTNLTNSILVNADLSGVGAWGANFTNADFTGACINGWRIDNTTKFNGVKCTHIYMKSNQEERVPYNSNEFFKPRDFQKLIQKAQNTVDLIFTNGIDWQAFLKAFLKLKSETGDELSIYSIEDKWDNYFVVRVNVPHGADKEKLAEALNREYELKEDKKFLQQQIASLTMSVGSLSETLRKKRMSGDTFNINANNSPVSIAKDNATQNIHSINEIFEQHQDISEVVAEIQKLLTQFQNQGLSESDAQEKVADELATKAKSDSTIMEKLKSFGASFGSASGKALVTEGVKAVFKLALNKAGIHLE
ncbi:pentapeptide repeat-containing protein [Pseudanabaena galeata UHCC 0370]|uniref:Pentapeptide repeat-containing protein n=1 Tax=Pseudanabaena galeata UHCC 0370 TaxID=3110310 RepID=A0ABU5TGD9_9CYAN|nr:pentapeptide repeat-containing protein [Pseudanabaena galeata]MEA5477367.1 pentapeptide repeat-containing protein [Pseudanabaena galeata UHCC 0370]